jgi:hypothetical protein
MPLYQDAIEAQRSQYPYSLPPTAEQEALQPTNILGDLAQRWAPAYSNFWFGRYGPQVTSVLSSVMPMLAAGPAGKEEAAAEALPTIERATTALRTGTEPLRRNPLTQQFEYFNPDEPQFPSTESALTREIPSGPASRTTGLSYAGQLGKPTAPMPELAAQPPMYHGTPDPVGTMLGPKDVPGGGRGLMMGPGTYVTSDYEVAEGYAGVRGPRASGGGAGSGQIYQVYEIRPDLKFIDADKDLVPVEAMQGAIKRLPPEMQKSATELLTHGLRGIQTHLSYPMEELGPGEMKPRTLNTLFQISKHFVDPETLEQAFTDELERKGYAGLTHEGGRVLGGPKHRVKVYWNPERDIHMTPVKWRFPNEPVGPPTAGSKNWWRYWGPYDPVWGGKPYKPYNR